MCCTYEHEAGKAHTVECWQSLSIRGSCNIVWDMAGILLALHHQLLYVRLHHAAHSHTSLSCACVHMQAQTVHLSLHPTIHIHRHTHLRTTWQHLPWSFGCLNHAQIHILSPTHNIYLLPSYNCKYILNATFILWKNESELVNVSLLRLSGCGHKNVQPHCSCRISTADPPLFDWPSATVNVQSCSLTQSRLIGCPFISLS